MYLRCSRTLCECYAKAELTKISHGRKEILIKVLRANRKLTPAMLNEYKTEIGDIIKNNFKETMLPGIMGDSHLSTTPVFMIIPLSGSARAGSMRLFLRKLKENVLIIYF